MQPLLCPLPAVAAPAKLCLAAGRRQEAPNKAIFPKRAGWAARSPRQVQAMPTKGRQRAEGTDPHPQAGREGNGTRAMSEGAQPTAKAGKDGHITYDVFTIFTILARYTYSANSFFFFKSPFQLFFSTMRGTEHPLPAQCHRKPFQLRRSCSREVKADHGTDRVVLPQIHTP